MPEFERVEAPAPVPDGPRWVRISQGSIDIKTPHISVYRDGRATGLLCGKYKSITAAGFIDLGPAGADDPTQPGGCVLCLETLASRKRWHEAHPRAEPAPEKPAELPAVRIAPVPVPIAAPEPTPTGRTLVITEHRGVAAVAQEPAAVQEAEAMATACENFIRAFYTGKFPLPPEGIARLFDISARVGAFRALREHGVMVDAEDEPA